MTGLDKIIRQIQLDAENTADSIKAKSEAECSQILAEAKAQADAVVKEGEDKALKKYEDIIARANSSAQLEERKILLSARQNVISSMVGKALSYVKTMPDDEYFVLIYKMISKYSDSAEGVITLGKKDMSRLPADFESKANSCAKGKLSLSAAPADIDGGFILIYGGVEVNCSFDSLFSDNSEKISDAVAKLLFA